MITLFSIVIYMRDGQGRGIGPTVLNVSVNAIFFFGYAYLTAFVLVKQLVTRKSYLLFFSLFILCGILISWLKFIFSDLLFYNAIADMNNEISGRAVLSDLIMNTKDMTFIVAVFLVAKYSKDNYHMNRRVSELKENQVRSEIRLLKNQLDPDVVFNNLNNLYTLSLNNPEKVAENIAKFRSVLSYYFLEGKSQSVALSKELVILDNYTALEKLRYGERLNISFEVEGEIVGKKIIPLILFSIVENCFEHGCRAQSGPSWIKIVLRSYPDSIKFRAANSRPGACDLDMASIKGRDKDIVRKLELFYPENYSYSVFEDRESYNVDLSLKI